MTIHIRDIELSKLVASKANLRRTGKTERIEELAASISAHGLLQNLTVRPTADEKFEVIAGGRRLAALKLLAKRKQWAKDAPVPCQIVEGDNVTEISLAENALQCPMHPADQFEAFAALHRQDMNIEDIAARFGVTPQIVTQRLKLGAVSKKLMNAYRAGEMNLEQLSAFAITDNHSLQEKVWRELGYNKSRRAILEALNEGQVSTEDRRALYVGTEAYVAAGGHITRDLFDEEGGGFCDDAALLNSLTAEKLAIEAKKVSAEGWKWVAVELETAY
jgi:ParB family chromosome partitioning protein